jgi:hypothetical protein
MTVGKPGVAYLLSHGWHSVSDLIVRSHTIYANLRQSSAYIEKSSLYKALDPSEKSGVSYFMGMVAAKILADRLLDTPWLFHVSMLKTLGGSVDLLGKSQPDLVGLRKKRDWIVVEAKGRTGRHNPYAMSVAKLQTRQLRKVNGQYPSVRVAIQASFATQLEWAIEDPDEFDEDAKDIEFGISDALRMYYSSTLAASEQGDVRLIGGREFLVSEIKDIGVTVGIDTSTRARVLDNTLEFGGEIPSVKSSIEGKSDQFVIFPDGIAVLLDERWTEERMCLSPTARRG